MGSNDAAEMLEVAKEECGRLEREVATLRAEKDSPHADAKYWAELLTERNGRVKDYEWMTAKITGVADERDAALAVIERVKAARSDHPMCDVHDADDLFSCGWKRAVVEIDAALARPAEIRAGNAAAEWTDPKPWLYRNGSRTAHKLPQMHVERRPRTRAQYEAEHGANPQRTASAHRSPTQALSAELHADAHEKPEQGTEGQGA